MIKIDLKIKIIILILVLVSSFSLIPQKAEALGIPFGGPSVFGIPCTCSFGNAVWFWDYSGATNPLGIWTYPTANYKPHAVSSQGNIFLTPGIQALGSYVPAYAGQCEIYAGTTCIPLPLQGIMPPAGTPPGVGSSGTPLRGITGVAGFGALAGIAEGIFNDAKSKGGSGSGACGITGKDCKEEEKASDPVKAPVLCDTKKSGFSAIGECDNDGPVGFACRPSVPIVEKDKEVRWYLDSVGSSGHKYVFNWEGEDIKSNINSIEATARYSEPGIKTVDVYIIPDIEGAKTDFVTCSVEVVEKKEEDLKVGCVTERSVVSNVPIHQSFPEFKKVTWKSKVVGGEGPYKYTWTGDMKFSTAENVEIDYKNAPVGVRKVTLAVTDADGQTASASCSLEVVGN